MKISRFFKEKIRRQHNNSNILTQELKIRIEGQSNILPAQQNVAALKAENNKKSIRKWKEIMENDPEPSSRERMKENSLKGTSNWMNAKSNIYFFRA